MLYNAGAKLNLTGSTKEYTADLTKNLKDICFAKEDIKEDKEPAKEFTMHVEVVEIDIVDITGDHDIAE